MNWEIFLASFAGSLIELVEILGLALVVGRVAGWQNALVGCGSGIGLTLIVASMMGKSLTLIPVDILRIIAGSLLLYFGQSWMRSVVKYYGGIPKGKKEEDPLDQLANDNQSRWNGMAIATTFKGALLDSVEVAIAVVTLGAAGQWFDAIGGAVVAAIALIVLAFLFRTPLNRVPLKPMKFVAAMLLMGFGTYWLGKGLNVEWPFEEAAIIWLPLTWGSIMAIVAAYLRWRIGLQKPEQIIS